MKFNSLEFIFIFLPITCVVFYFLLHRINQKYAIIFLTISSFIFYGYWNSSYLFLVAGSISINFLLGRYISDFSHRRSKTLLLTVGIGFNLGLLGYFKYANFFVDTISVVIGNTHQMETVILPLAISFFTFQQIAYLVDAKNGAIKESSFLHYCLFVTFFPQLIAGPIVHHREMMPQFASLDSIRPWKENITVGATVFCIGLAKKTLIADSLAGYADPVFAAADTGTSVSMLEAWGGVLAYSFQIYFDFSGYSDMAIGLGRLFGINLPLNFMSPYRASSISEFWRRWHITLSRFLKNYLYIPLGGNRYGATRTIISVMGTMLLGGLWHGAAWTFVIWGGMHGCFLLINRLWRHMLPGLKPHLGWRAAGWVMTFFCVSIAWVFFRAESIAGAGSLLSALFGQQAVILPESYLRFFHPFQGLAEKLNVQWGSLPLYGGKEQLALLATSAFIVFCLPNTYQIMNGYLSVTGPRPKLPFPAFTGAIRWQPMLFPALLFGGVAALAVSAISRTSPFIYFNF